MAGGPAGRLDGAHGTVSKTYAHQRRVVGVQHVVANAVIRRFIEAGQLAVHPSDIAHREAGEIDDMHAHIAQHPFAAVGFREPP